jgi:phage tail-like protein
VGNFNFRVEIDGITAGHFTGVDGLQFEQEVIEFQDGDDMLLRKRPGRVKFGDITLKKGYLANTILHDWLDQARVGDGRGQYQRKNISVVLIDNANEDIKRWNCYECFPKSWKISSLDGKGNDAMTEELVFVLEWFEEA